MFAFFALLGDWDLSATPYLQNHCRHQTHRQIHRRLQNHHQTHRRLQSDQQAHPLPQINQAHRRLLTHLQAHYYLETNLCWIGFRPVAPSRAIPAVQSFRRWVPQSILTATVSSSLDNHHTRTDPSSLAVMSSVGTIGFQDRLMALAENTRSAAGRDQLSMPPSVECRRQSCTV